MLFMILALVVIFESAYCLISLFYLNKIKTNSQLFSVIEIGAYSLVLLMGLWMLLENKSGDKVSQKNTLYRGLLSIIIHPQQIPFWIIIGVVINPVLNLGLGWNTIVGFVCFNALGTLLIMTIYMIYGNKLIQYFKVKLNQLNTMIGILYIVLAVFSLSKMIVNWLI